MKLLQGLALVAVMATSNAFAYVLSPATVHATGSWPETAAVGDVDGDGRDDVVLTTSFYFDEAHDYKVFVYFQQPDGTLAQPKLYDYGGYANRNGLQLADLDKDGRKEIVVGWGGGITILDWSPARKTMLKRSFTHVDFYSQAADDVAVLDVNRDGKLDVVGQTWSDGAIVYFGDGSSGISRTTRITTPVYGYNDVEVGDFNGDGFDDYVVLSGQGFTHAWVYYNDGTDDFSTPLDLDFHPDGGATTGTLGAGDFNDDGRDDLIIMYDRTQLVIYHQAANGTFQAPQLRSVGWDPAAVVGQDVDLDGRDDLLVAYLDGNVGVATQEDGIGLGTEIAGEAGGSIYNTQGLAAGDINGDACPDIVSANTLGLVVWAGADCNGVADLAVSLGLTTSVVSVRMDNFGTIDAASPEAIVALSVQEGTLSVGTLPPGCTLQAQSSRTARVSCTGAALAADASRTLLLPITVGGGSIRTVLSASAMVTTTSVEDDLTNNKVAKTMRGATLTPALKAKTSR